MAFEWDEAKRESNLQRHRLDFVDAEAVFNGIVFTFEDDRFDYDEPRYITLGILNDVVVIVHTERDDNIRIISMRKASKYEQKLYFKALTN